MKKQIVFILLLTLILSACASNAKPAEKPAEEPAAEETAAEETAEAEETDPVKEAAMAYFTELPEDKHMIFVPELFEKMDAGEEMLIIDIRKAEDYAEGHLKGAVNVPYATVGENLTKIPDDIQIYIHCYTGQTGSQSTVLLNVLGKKVTNIQGGWKNGITAEEGYEAYTETEAHELPEGDYPVDETLAAAVADFYAKAPDDEHANFNFPPEELNELIEGGDVPYTVVSVRKPEDYAEAHIAGAVNIPYGKGMEQQLKDLPADKPVIVYCYTGQSGSQTMTILRLMGYEAYNLNGGFGSVLTESGWLGAGLPVEAANPTEWAGKQYFASLPEDKHMIFVPELFEKMDAGEDMLIIDIRTAEDYAEGHLKGAVNIPYATVGENLTKIPDDIQIYIHCYTGQTGSQSTVLLNALGKKVTNIQGGWKKGITAEEGYEAYTETEPHELPEGEYPVDEKVAAFAADFYAKAPDDEHANFNFPPEELAELIEAGDVPYTIVSVRKPEDYEQGHIQGAVNIPYGPGMQDQLKDLPKDKPVIVYCYTGQSGSQTMTVLRLMGYEAYNLNGGMGSAETESGWLGAGLPVVTE
jgi:rhodanese-related sulfurtransferase